MKKYGFIVGLLLVLGVFSGCGGANLQEEYQAELQKQAKMNSGTFDLVIDSVSIDVGDKDSSVEDKMMFDVIEKQLRGVSLTGSYQVDKKTKNQYVKLQLDALGQKLPLDFYSNHQAKELYINAALQQFAQFNSDLSAHTQKMENSEGKYISMTQAEALKAIGQKDLAAPKTTISDFIETLEKDTFKKDGDKLTHRFTKKEIQNYLSKQKETGLQKLESLSIDLTLDTKEHTKQGKITAKSTNDGASYTVKMTMNQTPKNNNKSVQLPKKEVLIPIEEFLKEVTSPTQVDDEAMARVLKNIEDEKEVIDAESAEKIKETYRQYLNDEQYQQVVQALDKVLAEKKE